MKESVRSYYHCSFAPIKAKFIYIQSTISLALLQLRSFKAKVVYSEQ